MIECNLLNYSRSQSGTSSGCNEITIWIFSRTHSTQIEWKTEPELVRAYFRNSNEFIYENNSNQSFKSFKSFAAEQFYLASVVTTTKNVLRLASIKIDDSDCAFISILRPVCLCLLSVVGL